MIFRGFTFGIDFKGGAEFDFPANGHTVTQARSALDGTGIQVEVAQSLSSSPPSIRIQTKPITEQQSEHVIAILQEKFNTKTVNSTSFGASWGSSVTTKSVEGLIVFLVLVMIYISLRFEPKMAAAAIVALLHDLIVTAGIYSLVGFEVTPATVIAVLTILGFSLYDTVVVFDKVRENTAGLVVAGRKTYTQAANEAVNQTLDALDQHLADRPAAGGLAAVHRRRPARRRDAEGPGARAARGARIGGLLLDLRRHPAAGGLQGARAADEGAAGKDRALAGCRCGS